MLSLGLTCWFFFVGLRSKFSLSDALLMMLLAEVVDDIFALHS